MLSVSGIVGLLFEKYILDLKKKNQQIIQNYKPEELISEDVLIHTYMCPGECVSCMCTEARRRHQGPWCWSSKGSQAPYTGAARGTQALRGAPVLFITEPPLPPPGGLAPMSLAFLY